MALFIKNSQNKISISRETVKKIVKAILSDYKISRYLVTIDFLDNRQIRLLNKKFLKKDYPTDCITFLYSDPSSASKRVLFADIAISAQMAIDNSRYFKTSVKQELLLYIIHALLHALGLKDTKRAQKQIMRKKEQEFLAKFNTLIKKL